MKFSNIEIGTSGWSFEDWAGVFYPFRVPKTKWLEYYAARFSLGELNSSYYRIPSADTFKGIAERTPNSFRMFIKAHADVTHARKNPSGSLGTLLRNAASLQKSGKLLGVLAQFPHSFHYSDEHLSYVLQLNDYVAGSRLCAEFRRSDWDNSQIREQLAAKGIVWVSPDEPRLPNLMASNVYRTGSDVYIRLHGRNSAAWYGDSGEERYNYHYSDQELKDYFTGNREQIAGAEKVYVLFNNCRSGNAIINALRLRQMIEGNTEQENGGNTDEFFLSAT